MSGVMIVQQYKIIVSNRVKEKMGSHSASGSYSSTISSYSTSINGASYTTNNFTTDFLTASGDNTCSVTVKDSRGRTTSQTINFNVVEYANPVINSFSVSRCNQGRLA